MNNNCNLPDTQNNIDIRHIVINKVGIKDIKYPFEFVDNNISQNTVGTWTMTVKLPENVKGTHMSRFIEILNTGNLSLSIDNFDDLLKIVKEKLQTNEAFIEVVFPFFRQKIAPISKVKSLMDYQVRLKGEIKENTIKVFYEVVIPVTSLCPCSKKISDFGAHNQRSHITLEVNKESGLSILDLIEVAEKNASSQLYAVLKREDEKFVTEEAYENPAFVEDLVRDLAVDFNNRGLEYYCIESENFESIHNHSAYAIVEKY
jgi:GTP cyclohydrolase I